MNTRFAKDIEYIHYYNSKSPIEIENEALNSPKNKKRRYDIFGIL